MLTSSLAEWLECLPKAWETGVQFQVELYQRLKNWYLMPPCLTLSIIRYGSRVKWSSPGKGVVCFPAPLCNSYWRGSLWVPLDYCCQQLNLWSYSKVKFTCGKLCPSTLLILLIFQLFLTSTYSFNIIELNFYLNLFSVVIFHSITLILSLFFFLLIILPFSH